MIQSSKYSLKVVSRFFTIEVNGLKIIEESIKVQTFSSIAVYRAINDKKNTKKNPITRHRLLVPNNDHY